MSVTSNATSDSAASSSGDAAELERDEQEGKEETRKTILCSEISISNPTKNDLLVPTRRWRGTTSFPRDLGEKE